MANVNQCFKIKDDFLFKDFLTDSLVFNQVKDISSILNSLKNLFFWLYIVCSLTHFQGWLVRWLFCRETSLVTIKQLIAWRYLCAMHRIFWARHQLMSAAVLPTRIQLCALILRRQRGMLRILVFKIWSLGSFLQTVRIVLIRFVAFTENIVVTPTVVQTIGTRTTIW